MTIPTADISGHYRAPALFALGFRPFYLLAAGLAAAWIPLWVAVWHGHLALPSGFSPLAWHTHEMLFGFTSAVLVGFLLTAVPNWTGRPTITGAPLAGLAVLWLAGRALMLTGADLPWQVVAAVDVAFLPLAGVAMLRPLIATKNRRNIVFPIVLILLALANLALHLDAAGVVDTGAASRGGTGGHDGHPGAHGRPGDPVLHEKPPADAERGQNKRLDILAIVATVLAAVLSVAAPMTTSAASRR